MEYNVLRNISYGGITLLSTNTLRNIQIKDFESFFKEYNMKNRTVLMKPDPSKDRYQQILDIINNESISPNGSFNKQNLDDFIFNYIFYGINNWQYLYRFDSLIFNKDTPCDKVIDLLSKNSQFKFNSLISDAILNDFDLCTTRIECDNNKLSKIEFLIKIGTIDLPDGPTDFFTGIVIDIEMKAVLFKFYQHMLDIYKSDPSDLLKTLKNMIMGIGKNQIFSLLNLNILSLNEEEAHNTIYKIFKNLSIEAEEALNEKIPPNTIDNIRQFLENNSLPASDDYIEQIKAVLFQDIAKTLQNKIFKNGWVFRFLYREGNHTRASSKTDDRSSIYSSKVYWHLKELIFKEEKMYEIGVLWYTSIKVEDFIEVRLEARNDSMIINYYSKSRDSNKRKAGDYFVLRKIVEYLP